MANILEQPKQFKVELKDKWLDYYRTNVNWIKALMDADNDWYTDVNYKHEELKTLGYINYSPRRPDSRFILGVITNLEPQLKGLLELLPDCQNKWIQQLGLHFDPEIELKKRSLEKKEEKEKNGFQEIDKIREELKT